MTQYNSLNVKLSNSQLNKLKSTRKNETEVFKNILPGIQFNDKKYNKKLKHCWYMNRKKYL